MKERRTATRYDLSLPVIVRPPFHGEAAFKTGLTRDISNRGVYFTIDCNLNAGAELDLTMILPTDCAGSTEVSIKASGKVIRMHKHFGDKGQEVDVVAVFEIFEIVRNENTVAQRRFRMN
jgi:hypothetical protein